MSPEDDRRLQDELRRTDSLYSTALLLTRLTGIRIGECIHLTVDCLCNVGPDQWALHVPLGKLHNERLVPLDSEALCLVHRILEIRALASPGRLAKTKDFLVPRVGGRFALFQMLRLALADFARRAGCTDKKPISPHRLRHYATSGTMPPRRTRVGCNPCWMRRSLYLRAIVMRHSPAVSQHCVLTTSEGYQELAQIRQGVRSQMQGAYSGLPDRRPCGRTGIIRTRIWVCRRVKNYATSLQPEALQTAAAAFQ